MVKPTVRTMLFLAVCGALREARERERGREREREGERVERGERER
jgi:hypothetical protein